MTIEPTATLGQITLWIIKRLFLLLAALSLLVAGATAYARWVFPHSRPTRALSAIFQNPAEAQVVRSTQNGAFMVGRHAMYVAKISVQGEQLKLQPYLQISAQAGNSFWREFWTERFGYVCSELLNQPPSEISFHSVGENAPGGMDSYVAYSKTTHTYCVDHLQL
ncbi:hypothetical protein [Deinococcus sp.]|uniref:hypothetical protein n=1 Tax=Deinococcus sp. TaxID=47478 RepID=UPI003B5AC22E